MHPKTAGFDWNLADLIYDDGSAGIAIAMFERAGRTELSLGFRWLWGGAQSEIGGRVLRNPYFGQDSDWILLPHEFAVPAAKTLIVKHAAGMKVNIDGYNLMLQWLKKQEEVVPHISY